MLVPDCGGASCAAVDATTYSGSGIGVWRYNNSSGTDARIDINISGVSAGKVATLVFSNGSEATASAPSSGVLASPATASPARADAGTSLGTDAGSRGLDDSHAQMLEKNRAFAAGLIGSGTGAKSAAADLISTRSAAVTRLSFSPAVGTTRTWIDNAPSTPVAYSTSVQFVCSLPSGRDVVWWVDPTIVSSGKFTAAAWSAALSAMQTSYCGSTGGLVQLTALLGDVWGPGSSRYTNLIQDTPGSPQNVNVVLLNVPASSTWAGYFFGGNNLLKTASASSNEALAFFINADQVKLDINFVTSTLLHESTHMVNFYQRSVVRGVIHDTWLEETSAMMTEDIVVPTVVNGYDKILVERLPAYLATGGNVSYINWPTLANSAPNYAIGGGFGAFLNRRYGLSIYQQLVTSCSDGVSANAALTSYACLEGLIQAGGGVSFSDEFARFGATALGQLPVIGTPRGYGYPATVAGAYSLQAKDLSAVAIAAAAARIPGLAATSHTYQRDTCRRKNQLRAQRCDRARQHNINGGHQMSMPKIPFSGIGLLRWVLAVALLALGACVNGASDPVAGGASVSISGNLTLKGSEPGAWWAVTDDQGRIWKITSPTPDQVAMFQRAQNHRVSIEGRRQEKYLNFEQIRPSRVTTMP